ncbi:MAG: L,D-transpeptidase family protein [Steroidobacteraceae bacterium]
MWRHSGKSALVAVLTMLAVSACASYDPGKPSTAPEVQVDVGAEVPYALSAHRAELTAEAGDLIGVLQVTHAQYEDTFVDLARRFNVGFEELVRANPTVDPWLPGEGREIVLPTQHLLPNAPREGVVINLAAMRLYFFVPTRKGETPVVYTLPIGIGKVGMATPQGRTRITRMAKNPSWRPGPGVRAEYRANGEILPAVVKPGPDNPLGTRAMYLGWPAYLIHGTNKPAGIGLRSSAGCIRLFPEDVEFLYDMIKPGIPVTVVNQPFVFGWHRGELFMQAYDVLEDDARDWRGAQRKLLSRTLAGRLRKELAATGTEIDWQAVGQLSRTPRGIAVPVSKRLTESDAPQDLNSLIAVAPRVRNAVPIGATWLGEPVEADFLTEEAAAVIKSSAGSGR